MQKTAFIENFIRFLDDSPTPWHTVANLAKELIKADFKELQEKDRWELSYGESYFVQRDGALIACRMPIHSISRTKILASHTDSPSLKLKPNPESSDHQMTFLLVEPYGSPILPSWLNRDLVIAGRAIVESKDNKIHEFLVKLDEHPLIIPSLALHLEEYGKKNQLNIDKQKHLAPLADIKGEKYLEPIILANTNAKRLIDFDLYLIPSQPARKIGKQQELLAASRLDNLTGVHAAMTSLLNSANSPSCLNFAVFFNAEEIGSRTYDGAAGVFLDDVFQRIMLKSNVRAEEIYQIKSQSTIVSIDVAHAYHPSYSDRYDPNHILLLGKGPVFKYSAEQKYTTTAKSALKLLQICQKNKLPYQKFVTHSQVAAGSTIGPISAANLGIQSVDIGVAQLSMHSAREIIAVEDQIIMYQLLKKFLKDHEDR
jgi:aspartyl aminopeptidase